MDRSEAAVLSRMSWRYLEPEDEQDHHPECPVKEDNEEAGECRCYGLRKRDRYFRGTL